MGKKTNKPIEKRNNNVGNETNKIALEVAKRCKDLPHLQKPIKYLLK